MNHLVQMRSLIQKIDSRIPVGLKVWQLEPYLKRYLSFIAILAENGIEAHQIRQSVSLKILILILTGIHLLLISIWPLNTQNRSINYDFTLFFYQTNKQIWNILWAPICVQLALFLYRLYWFRDVKQTSSMLLVKQIVYEDEERYFVDKTVQIGQKRRSTSQWAKFVSLYCFKLLNFCVLLIGELFFAFYSLSILLFQRFFCFDIPY